MQNKHRKDEDALLKKKADERELLRKKKQNMQKGSNPTIPPLETDESVLIDTAIDYFYEQGINEEGLDLIIEEVGVDTFTDFIIDLPQQLDEERSATKAPKRDYAKVKAAVYKKDAARKEKGTGEYSTTKAAKAKYGDEEAPEGKVATATTKAKKVQPKKPATKQGLGDRIKSAYKAGVKRHRKATQVPRVFAKGVKSGAKKAVKFAKDVHKAVNEDEVKGNENVKVNPKIGSTCEKCAGLLVDNCCQNCGHKQKVSESYSVVLERLGGKGYSRSAYKGSIHPPSRKSSGDWPDSDRGAGNKAKRRAGEKVKAKSPTYLAWVKNKKLKEDKVKGNENVKVNPKIGPVCPDCAGLVVDEECQNCGKKCASSDVKEGFKTQYGKKGKLSKTDAPGSRHDHTHDVDPRMADHVPNKKVRKSSKAETRANVLKFDMKKEEVVSEAERKLADRLQRKRELYKKTTKKALDDARRTGEASGHNRYRMGSLDREMDGIKAKMNKEETVNELNRYGKETGKATGSLNKRAGSPVKSGGDKDSAVNTVRRMIRKDTGRPEGQQKKVKGAKSTAGTGKFVDKLRAKRTQAANVKKAGFKNQQDYANTMARYGGEDNYKKGRGLGT